MCPSGLRTYKNYNNSENTQFVVDAILTMITFITNNSGTNRKPNVHNFGRNCSKHKTIADEAIFTINPFIIRIQLLTDNIVHNLQIQWAYGYCRWCHIDIKAIYQDDTGTNWCHDNTNSIIYNRKRQWVTADVIFTMVSFKTRIQTGASKWCRVKTPNSGPMVISAPSSFFAKKQQFWTLYVCVHL